MDKRKISIVLALVLAVMAVMMVKNYISKTESKFTKQEKKAYILVAAKNIKTGSTIDETMVKFAPIPEMYVQPKALSSQSMATGKRALADIFEGEQIMASKLTIVVKDTSLAMRTPSGKRAITVTIEPLLAVGGKIRAGDYVDVIGIFPYDQRVDGKVVTELVSVTLFQNVLILTVELGGPPQVRGQAAPQGSSSLVVTFALSPREIGLLSYALEQGKLRLVLRPPLETAIEPVPPVEVNTMWQYIFSNLGQEFITSRDDAKMPPIIQVEREVKEVIPEPPPVPLLEVYRGTEKSTVRID